MVDFQAKNLLKKCADIPYPIEKELRIVGSFSARYYMSARTHVQAAFFDNFYMFSV